MSPSYTAEDLKSLLQRWWNPTSTLALPSNAGDSRSAFLLQQAEAMMAQLPTADVAHAVLELVSSHWREPASENAAEIPNQQRISGLLTAWTQAEKKHWQRRRQELDEALSQFPVSASTDSEESPVDTFASATDNSPWLNALQNVYSQLPASSPLRYSLLGVLAWQDRNGLEKLSELLVDDAPVEAEGISKIFSPLVYRDDLPADALYPKLLQAMSQLPLATAVLDHCNFLYRERHVRPHAATKRKKELADLLASVTQRLLKIEEAPAAAGVDVDRLSQIINDSVGLIASLCDALALIGDPNLVGKIYPCLEVKHRRVQLEAATALATLGEADGKKRLIEMAAEPVVRRRVLAYCQQLGFLSEVDAKFQTEGAEAESELALWLSHPSNMGFAPLNVSVIDQKLQYWPGFDEPVSCFLLGFSYPFEQQVYQNVGLVGPITHAFSTSLIDLPADDVYAIFAGWHVDHPEIYAIDFAEAGPLQTGTIARLERRLRDEGFSVLQSHLLGHCLGEWSLIARASREEREGWVVSDLDSCIWLPDDAGFASFEPSMAWFLYLGRRLLNQFNSAAPTES